MKFIHVNMPSSTINETQLPERYQLLGRRTHRISKLADLDDPIKVRYAEQMYAQLGATVDNSGEFVYTIIKRFI